MPQWKQNEKLAVPHNKLPCAQLQLVMAFQGVRVTLGRGIEAKSVNLKSPMFTFNLYDSLLQHVLRHVWQLSQSGIVRQNT